MYALQLKLLAEVECGNRNVGCLEPREGLTSWFQSLGLESSGMTYSWLGHTKNKLRKGLDFEAGGSEIRSIRSSYDIKASARTRFATFGVPQPLASSQPGVALNPTFNPSGSVLFPTVISWKANR